MNVGEYKYSEGALGALHAVLLESSTADAGRDPRHGSWTLVFTSHHRLHGVAPHTHGPLTERERDRRRG